VRAVSFAGDAMRQLTSIATLIVALVTPAAARSRLVVLDRPTLACSDQQALETVLTLARLHDGPAFRDHARSYGCMWIEPDDGPLAVVGDAIRHEPDAVGRLNCFQHSGVARAEHHGTCFRSYQIS
jgi:hypothetical protein